jgi:hypothetical protein
VWLASGERVEVLDILLVAPSDEVLETILVGSQ